MNLKTLAAAVAVGLLGAGSAAYAQDKGTIGIAMPTKTSGLWCKDRKQGIFDDPATLR
jgi:putative multiple sugar transport system substrate-binding protein